MVGSDTFPPSPQGLPTAHRLNNEDIVVLLIGFLKSYFHSQVIAMVLRGSK